MKKLVGSRAQAAIFDGIMFLLFSSVSVALIFVFLNGYGISQDASMRSAYAQAYIQDAAKSLFYVDVRTLSQAAIDDDVLWKDPNAGFGTAPCNPSAAGGEGCPYWDLKYGPNANDHCDALAQYYATTVADLVKRDLGDSDACSVVKVENGQTTVVQSVCPPPGNAGSGTSAANTGQDNSALVCLDNHFGLKQGSSTPCELDPVCTNPATVNQCPVPTAHGKTALRCALKEVMKPLHLAGYYYLVEVVNRFPAEHPIPLKQGTNRITNYWPANEGVPGEQWRGCDDVVTRGYTIAGERIGFQVLTVSMPFRVPRANRMDEMRDFILKICVWPGKS